MRCCRGTAPSGGPSDHISTTRRLTGSTTAEGRSPPWRTCWSAGLNTVAVARGSLGVDAMPGRRPSIDRPETFTRAIGKKDSWVRRAPERPQGGHQPAHEPT